MLKFYHSFPIFLAVLVSHGIKAQSLKEGHKPNWTASPLEHKVFIDNNGGQFDGQIPGKDNKIYAGADVTGVELYFTKQGITYKHSVAMAEEGAKEENERDEQKLRNTKVITSYFSVLWKNSNPAVEIIPEGEGTAYYSYSTKKGNIIAHVYNKLLYRNVYPGIDVEYSFPNNKTGIEYSIIVHPGADLSEVKLIYPDAERISKDNSAALQLQSDFGLFTDHGPRKVYYAEDKQALICSTIINGKAVAFNAGNYDHSKTLVIDPWLVNPAYAGYNKAYDVDYDFKGNVYVYGGQARYQLEKYDNTGTWLWAYSTILGGSAATAIWAGDLTVDHRSGTSYIVSGLANGGPPDAAKISSSGNLLLLDSVLYSNYELWRVRFDYCNNLLVLGEGLGGQAATMDTNFTGVKQGNVLGTANPCHDMCFLALDQLGSAYFATARTSFTLPVFDNTLLRTSLPFLAPTAYQVSDGYTFAELSSLKYYPDQPNGGYDFAIGFNGMAANGEYLLTYDGETVKIWNPATGVLEKSLAVSGAPFLCGGLDIDCADNIYVGCVNQVNVYDSALTLLSTIPLADTVYDVKLGNYQVYACGSGFLSSTPYTTDSIKVITTSKMPTSCTACDGTANAYITGCGTDSTEYSYMWSNGQTTSAATGLCYGTYHVTVTLNCEQKYIDSVVLPDPGTDGMTLTLSQTNVTCANTSNGTASVTVTGGITPYTYSWQPTGSTTSSVSGLTAGSYTVIVSDNGGGCVPATFVIEPPPVIDIYVSSQTNNVCVGTSTGGATVIASGGAGPYKYNWSPSGGTDSTATNLSVGIYTITVTDKNGCTGNDTVNITYTSPFNISLTTTNATCSGLNGTAKVSITGSSGLDFITWSASSNTGDSIGNIPPGTYYVTVRDSNTGCIITDTFKIKAANVPVLLTTQANINCFGLSDGSASVTASGGAGTYTYSWSNGATASSINNVTAGTYNIIVSDSAGCSNTATITITQPLQITQNLASTNASCTGVNDGSASVSPVNGTPPYTYLWSPTGSTNASITGLSAGGYTVTITDANGCSIKDSVTITTLVPVFALTGKDSLCSGYGEVLTASGGSTYIWSTGATTSSINISPATSTTYSVVIINSAGCKDSIKKNIIVSPNPEAVMSGQAPICKGDSITLTASGGVTYLWSTGATTSSIRVSPATTSPYSVIAFNSGCSDTASDTVMVNPLPVIDACCYTEMSIGQSTKLTASGGGTYLWSPSTGLSCTTCPDPLASPTQTTVYTVTVTSDSGCVVSDTVTVAVQCGNVFVPDAFSPNGDGQNDVLYVRGKCIKAIDFIIYDRWGNKIFESKDMSIGWDGIYGGQPMNTGTYVYYLVVLYEDGVLDSKKGTVELVR